MSDSAEMTIQSLRYQASRGKRPEDLLSEARTRAYGTAEWGAFITITEDSSTCSNPDIGRDNNQALGALGGIPFGVKDNIATRQAETTGGTGALRGCVPFRDASVVKSLRDAGGLLVGKTNLHELAFGVTSNNAIFGPVRNPHDPSRSPGGSSGGSAVAVALGVVPFALGTDTGGSVRIPAAHCGVVGFRPTTGRWPSDGVIKLSRTRDTIGVMANSVADVTIIDSIVTGLKEDTASARSFSDLRIGVPRQGFYDDLDPHVSRSVEAGLAALEHAGVQLIEIALGSAIEMDERCGIPIVLFESPSDLLEYLRSLPAPYDELTLEGVISAVGSPDVRSVLELAATRPFSDEEYESLLQVRLELKRLYESVFVKEALAAVVYPTVALLAPLIDNDGTTMHNGRAVDVFTSTIRNTGPGSVAGVPSLSVPLSTEPGSLPVGLCIEGRAGHDRDLLAVAALLEQVVR